MCEKLSFDTFNEGQKVISNARSTRRKINNRHRATKIPQRCYKCPDCGKFHLTSKKKENKIKRYK